jgi:hypothetical protein
MGRPINSRNFGPPTAGGNEIKVNFNAGAGVKEGFIRKQKAARRFEVVAIGDDPAVVGNRHVCTLTPDTLPADLTTGEMSILTLMDDNETYTISKISGRKATLSAPSATGSNLYDGKSVAWTYTADLADGAAQVEEAGDDNILVGTDDDDFTEDA